MYPVAFDVDYVIQRDPLTVFFRLFLAIPWLIVAYLYAIAALIGAVIAWFAIGFTGGYPQGIYNFVSGYVRFAGRLAGWLMLAVDPFPPFTGSADPDYPVHVDVGPRLEEYNRAKTFFRIVLAFPLLLLSHGAQLLTGAAAFVTWWRVLVTGKQSATMHDALRVGLAFTVRTNAYMLLLTEVYPRVLDLPPVDYPDDAPGIPRA